MGLDNRESLRLIVDLETFPVDDAADYLDPIEPISEPDLSQIQPAKNLVDPVKVAADIEKRKQAAMDDYREKCEQQERKRVETLERCSLDVDLCRVVALGWMREDWNEPTGRVCQGEREEAAAIAEFWRELGQRSTIGYNVLQFDLMVLSRRSLYLGVPAPFLNLDKYRSPHVDLQQRLSFNGVKPYRSLNWYCRRFKLNVPQDDHDGKAIGQLVKAGDWTAVEHHCTSDIYKTRALAERMGVLKPIEVEALF